MSTSTSSTDQNVIVAQPLDPDAQSYQVMNNTDLGQGQLFALDPATGEYAPVGTASGFKYNALAYDTNTDFLYAIAASSGSDVNGNAVSKGTLVQIDKNGNTFAISDIEGGAAGGMIMADFLDGAMIVGNSKTKTFYSIDVTTGEATELTRTDSTGLANDLAAVDGKLYGVSNGNLREVTITGDTVSVSTVKLSGGPDKFPAGAIWAATNENGESELYAFDNQTGDIYRIDGFAGENPEAVKVSTGFTPSNSNDGARNPEAVFEVPVSAPAPAPEEPTFSGEGIFTTGSEGNMTMDFMYDGGGFQSEIAVFSVEGMTAEPGTEAFIQEAARRALTNDEGYVLIKDSSEGAKANFKVDWEKNFAHGEYKGPKSFYFDPGTQFAVMLVQNISVEKLADDPSLATEFGNQAIFSLPEANAGGAEQGRIADFNGLSTTGRGLYGMEDIAVVADPDQPKSDRDYNDIVFQIMGATGNVANADEVSNENRKFSEVAQEIIDYSKRTSFFSGGTFVAGDQGTVHLDFLFDGGFFHSEMAIFSLEGMEQYVPGSESFIKEATRRALMESPEGGYSLIKDNTEGAKFSSKAMDGGRDFNSGEYKGEKAFVMKPGSEFAVLMVQDTSIRAVYEDPKIAQNAEKRIIFSIPEANKGTSKRNQIVDINGAGEKGWGAYVIEDKVIGLDGSDRDYNDIAFQIRGAKAQGIEDANDVMKPEKNWLGDDLGQQILAHARPFKEGSFMTDDEGVISFDYLFDGGGYRGEMAIFSLDGMDAYTPGSEEFIQEAARRAASDSTDGWVVLRDRNEGARFEGETPWEENLNGEKYRGIKTFQLNANQQYAVMSVRTGTVADIAEDPTLALQPDTRALFSLPEANGDGTQSGQIVELNGRSDEGFGLYAMEDRALAGEGADRDYNDIVFQIGGAVGDVVPMADTANESRNFLTTEVGQEVLTYSNRENLYTEGTFTVDESGEVNVDFLFDGGGFNKGELGIFNLSGMENYDLDSDAFLQEAARRALSSSNEGHVVIQDRKEAARFQSQLDWERNFNGGVHVGERTYAMNSGDQFALILSQNTSLTDLANNPSLASQFGKRAVFSIPEANPGTNLASQIVDLNGLASTGTSVYGMEDLQVSLGGSDRDFNDIVFKITGAVGVVSSADGEIREGRDWRELGIGQDILDFSTTEFDQHLQGDKGRNTLTGSIGADFIEGFKGRDILDGGLGDDLLTGGNGEDTFVLRADAGTDTITDFTQNYDVLGMSNGITFDDLLFSGNDILLKESGDVLATVSGFDTSRLSTTDFIMV